jgi:hypothetical protein
VSAAQAADVVRIAEELLADTDLLTPNHDGTPEWYAIHPQDLPQLIEQVTAQAVAVARADERERWSEGLTTLLEGWHAEHDVMACKVYVCPECAVAACASDVLARVDALAARDITPGPGQSAEAQP